MLKELTQSEFDLLRNYVRDLCGLVIPDEKRYLITHRLSPLARAEECSSWGEFHNRLTKTSNNALRDKIISAMTTNETSFFRDFHPFETFKNVILPALGDAVVERKKRAVQRKGSKVRLWCAASSTGQEPYTMSMIIHEYAASQKHRNIKVEDFSILATDISSRVLAIAMAGEFTKLEMNRGLPAEYKKYFHEENDKFCISEEIKTLVEFRKLNLTDRFTSLGGFDFIACRNVLIYFDDPTKKKILDQIYTMLAPKSYLMVGATEGLYGITDRFEAEQNGPTLIYRKL